MLMWFSVALAWLAGVAVQTSEAGLSPMHVYAGGTVLGGIALLWRWWVARRPSSASTQPSASKAGREARHAGVSGVVRARLRVFHPAMRHGLTLLAAVLLAWGSTGWRACARMVDQVPQAWQEQAVPVVVQVEGLPRVVPGGVLFDARVERWPKADASAHNNDGHDHHTGQRDHLPDLLSVRMPSPGGVVPRAGQRWRLSVKLHQPDGPSNPAAYDATLPYFERGVRAIASVQDKGDSPIKLSDMPARPWQGLIDRWRQSIRDAIYAKVPDKRTAGVLAGLSVGDQSAIDQADWDVFRNTGVAHLVSISGAHIAMFGWMTAALMRRCWSRWHAGVHRWPAPSVALWSAVAGSALYALLAGWGVPAQRTVWMMAIMALLRTRGRRWPWPLVWLVSAVVLTMLDPWSLRQVGFWLSYVAVGVLMSSDLSAQGQASARSPRIDGADERAKDAPKNSMLHAMARAAWSSARELMRTQWLLTLALMPLSLVCFQQTSIVGLLANLVAIPLFTLGITPLALLGAVWSPCWDVGGWLIQLGMAGLTAMSHWPAAVSTAPVLPWWVAVPAVLAGWSQAVPMHGRWRLVALPLCMPLVYLPQSWHVLPVPPVGQFQLLAADVGQGTAVLIRTSHHNLLFDTGPRFGADNNAGDRILLPLMRALGVASLDTLMISHQDTDHVGGAQAIVGHMPVSQLRTSLDELHPLRHQQGVGGEALSHQPCLAGQTWVWDGVVFRVLHPTLHEYELRAQGTATAGADDSDHDTGRRQGKSRIEPNAMSCVLQVRAVGQASAMLTGDIGVEQESAILSRAREMGGEQGVNGLRSTVLVVPHHGSQTSSSKAFLSALQPSELVIQVGRRNRYGHPSPKVLARYQSLGLPWQATPECGAYIWSSADWQLGPQVSAKSVQAKPHESDSEQGADIPQPAVGQCWRQLHHHYWEGDTLSLYRREPVAESRE